MVRSKIMDIQRLLNELTVEEKAALVAGTDFMYTNPVPRLQIPSVRMSDGPHGLRVQPEGGDNGISRSEPATAFPTAATIASSWNPQNTYKMGVAIAQECHHYGIDVVLGPGTNIKRNPLAGRNFEYFSEDPILAGEMAVGEVNGIQSKGIGVSTKHFALNNSENYRFMGDSVCDMRAMREIYLKPFEMIVKRAKPETVMCAYNKINGTFCCQNKWLLTDVLRKEWGFDGLVMTDWGATHDRLEMLRAGLDLEMPGDTNICRKWIVDGIESGDLDKKDLDKAVENVLRLAKKHQDKQKTAADFDAHHALAEEIAIDSAVLLKNNDVLPLDKTKGVCVVGELFEKTRYQGSGSSMINPARLSTPKSAFDNDKVSYVYEKGYKENQTKPDKELIERAVALAKEYKTVLVFAGLTDYVESEGADRESMRLPQNQLALLDALVALNKQIVVVLYGGSACELPFADKVDAILDMYLPGQNGGEAMRKLVFGERTPSGKLAQTWPLEYEDVPFGKDFSKTVNEIYKESVLVGYRYYVTANKPVRYPFGYGLSYTQFEYSDCKILQTDDEIVATVSVKNTGEFSGAEIVQLYVGAPAGDCFKPKRELKGFCKLYLEKGETKTATISVKKDDLRYWNVKENRWVLEDGEYAVEICSDALTVKADEKIRIVGEKAQNPYNAQINAIYQNCELDKMTDGVFEEMSGLKIPAVPPKKPIRLESRFSDMKATLLGRVLFATVLSVAKIDMIKAKRLPEGVERDNKIKGAIFLKRILESNSIITMSMSAGKSCPYNFAKGFVDTANGHIFKGIKDFCTPIKAPELPKDKKDDKEQGK